MCILRHHIKSQSPTPAVDRKPTVLRCQPTQSPLLYLAGRSFFLYREITRVHNPRGNLLERKALHKTPDTTSSPEDGFLPSPLHLFPSTRVQTYSRIIKPLCGLHSTFMPFLFPLLVLFRPCPCYLYVNSTQESFGKRDSQVRK